MKKIKAIQCAIQQAGSKKKLAEMLGISKSAVSNWTSNKKNYCEPSLYYAYKIIDIFPELNLTIKDLKDIHAKVKRKKSKNE